MGHYGKQVEPYLPLFRQADLNEQLRPRSDPDEGINPFMPCIP